MKKILIIRFSSLGDIILTFPVVRNIKLNNNDVNIYYLSKKNFINILKSNTDIDNVVTYKGYFNTIKELNNICFDEIIDLHSNLRSFIIRRLIKAKAKVNYKKDAIYRRIFVNFKMLRAKLNKHVVDRYLDAIIRLGYKIYTKDLDIGNISFFNKIEKKVSNIVIFQTAFLGDLILTLPLVRKIKSEFRNIRLSVVIREENLDVLKDIKEIDEIIVDRKKSKPLLKEFIRLKNLLTEKKFDLALIPHRSIRTALLAYLSKIKIRIGFDIKPSSFFYTHKVPFKWLIHDVERNLLLLKPIINNSDIEFPNIIYNDRKINELIPNIKPFILVNPSSIWETKKWPDYKFINLIEKIYNKYKTPVVLTGSSKEKKYLDLISSSLVDKVINTAGKTTLSDLLHLIKYADLLITNDSGPMHIAVLTKTPIIAIFGPTTKELGFFPYSDNSTVFESDIKCRPCKLHGSNNCPHKHFLCMKLIKVEDVFKEIEKILKYKYE